MEARRGHVVPWSCPGGCRNATQVLCEGSQHSYLLNRLFSKGIDELGWEDAQLSH